MCPPGIYIASRHRALVLSDYAKCHLGPVVGVADSNNLSLERRQYRQAAHYNVTHLRRQSFYGMPSQHIDVLSEPPFSMQKTFEAIDNAIDSNADLAEAILQAALPAFDINADDDSWKGRATPNDMDKASSTIKQFYRDWSLEGEAERHASHSPILLALRKYVGDTSTTASARKVLVPGAGLARLVLDLCAAGYSVEGNEISYHQLLASNYVLNCIREAKQHEIFPWALTFSNHESREDQLRSVAIPDVHPGTRLGESLANGASQHDERGQMSMVAGDFCSLYKEPQYDSMYDAVTTCFFVDTAPNIIRYIETIKHCLKPNGVWINLGPLLWHFEADPTPAERDKKTQVDAISAKSPRCADGIGEPGSIELSNDEVIALVQQLGFKIEEHTLAPAGETGYIQNPQSMLHNRYRPAFWVARKI